MAALKPGSDYSFLRYISLMGQLGLVMCLNILIMFFLVRFLAGLAGLAGGWHYLGIPLGIFSGFYSSYRLLERFLRKNTKDDK